LDGLAVSDLVRSMLRLGYTESQAYEVLTGAGLRGEMVQLIIEQVSSEVSGIPGTKPKLISELEEMRTGIEELRKEVRLLRSAICRAIAGPSAAHHRSADHRGGKEQQ
jgi:hypothetical protein